MAYLKIRLSENKDGECLFKFSNDVGETIRQTLRETMEIQYLQRREEIDSKGRIEIYMKSVPEYLRDKFQKAGVDLFVKNCGKMHDN